MNGPKYVELLKEKLTLHMHVNGCTISMQDGAPCHRSKVATEFLKTKQDLCAGMDRELPRLDPIENRWTIMKDKVTYQQSSSAENLRQAMKEVWVTEITF